MHPFLLERPADIEAAIASGTQAGPNGAEAEYISGGTDMVQLLQEDVRRPSRLVSLAGLLDDRIELTGSGLRLGAGATMASVAGHIGVASDYPVIAEALLNSASPQIRNQATIGGNILQRTRCPYFRDVGYSDCNKRRPGSGCAARYGENRWHAILGTSDHCIAVHASDLAVALAALDARVNILGAASRRTVNFADFHCLPGSTPHIESTLQRGEVVVSVDVPSSRAAGRSHYLKVRDRASFEFAVVSAAVALTIQNGRISEARVAVGGVATKPWRLPEVETALLGSAPEIAAYRDAATNARKGALGGGHNEFKIELVQRAIVRALVELGGRS